MENLVFLTVLALMSSKAMALTCKYCMQFDLQSDDEHFREFMDAYNALGKPENVNCKDNPDHSSIVEIECPALPEGQKAMCARYSTVSKFNIPGVDLTMPVYLRTCQNVQDDERAGCHDVSLYEDELREAIGPQAAMFGTTEGELCLCNGDNCNSQDAPPPEGSHGGDRGDGNGTGGAAAPVVLFSSFFIMLLHLV